MRRPRAATCTLRARAPPGEAPLLITCLRGRREDECIAHSHNTTLVYLRRPRDTCPPFCYVSLHRQFSLPEIIRPQRRRGAARAPATPMHGLRTAEHTAPRLVAQFCVLQFYRHATSIFLRQCVLLFMDFNREGKIQKRIRFQKSTSET